jgi:hypothetical protein
LSRDRQSCLAHDYNLTKDKPVGFIEARDIGDKDLEVKKKGKVKALPFGMSTPCIYIIVINTIVFSEFLYSILSQTNEKIYLNYRSVRNHHWL